MCTCSSGQARELSSMLELLAVPFGVIYPETLGPAMQMPCLRVSLVAGGVCGLCIQTSKPWTTEPQDL